VGALAAAGTGKVLSRKGALAAVAVLAVLARCTRLLEEKRHLLGHYIPESMPFPHAQGVMVGVVVAAVVALLLLEVFPNRPVRVALSATAAAAALAAIAYQGKIQVRPLWPEVDPHRIVCAEAVERIGQGPYRDRFALASHVLVGLIRANTSVGGSWGEELELWESAPPGTLFFWDNKYTGQRDQLRCPRGPLYQALERLGEKVLTCTWPPEGPVYAEVDVFVRRAEAASEQTGR
jgi:hypothetical protein